jgi:hypothetical protein
MLQQPMLASPGPHMLGTYNFLMPILLHKLKAEVRCQVITVTYMLNFAHNRHVQCHANNTDYVDPTNSNDKHNGNNAYSEFKLLVGSALELMCILYDKISTIGKLNSG